MLDDIRVPVRYVVASGISFGSRGDEQERIRSGLDAAAMSRRISAALDAG
ncbi:hypothetical protein [Nocardia farcinica]|nr:hypothetical protein [Nocardia farcinica]